MTDTLNAHVLKADIQANVSAALLEDVGDGDITARLIPQDEQASAAIITREDAIICGVDWVNEVARQVDETISIDWMVADGQQAEANQLLPTLCRLSMKIGPLRKGPSIFSRKTH